MTADDSTLDEAIVSAARELAVRLEESGLRIVFAESCTGGLVSASLVAVPGISRFHCGSAVVYRLDTKVRWLDVDADTLAEHGAVSAIVAKQMAGGVLWHTPEANVAVSITGDLGPNADPATDGIVHVGTASATTVDSRRIALASASRTDRQKEAVGHVLRCAAEVVANR